MSVFLDSNVLLYVASRDVNKAETALALIGAGGCISLQVLNDVANVAYRKMGMTWREIDEFLSLFKAVLTVHPLSVTTHETGLAVAERYGVSLYDAMTVASAMEFGCETLWSEDMHDGLQIMGGPVIRNPFR